MAATTEATCLESNSSSEKDSSCLKKQEENEGRRMVFFRKVMRRCLDKIMAAGRWVQKTVWTHVEPRSFLWSYDNKRANQWLSFYPRGSKPKVVITFNQYYLLSVFLVMHCSQEKFASCFSKIKERNPDEFKSITEQLMQHLQNNIEVELSWARCIESLPVHNLLQCLTVVWCGKCWHLRHLMSAILGLVSRTNT